MRSIKHALFGLFGIAGLTVSMFGLFKVPFAESAAKEYWRQALVAIVLIVGLAAGAVALFIYTFDANNFKAQIIEYVKVHKQRDLTLEGDIKVSFFPKLGLNSGHMTLSERNSNKRFASIDNARLYVSWLPLLRKQLEVDRVTLEGVQANVVRYKDGSTNLDDLLIHDSNLEATRFDIDSVDIGGASVDVVDEAEGAHFTLRDIHVATGRLTDSLPSNLSATFRVEADQPRISTQAKLTSHLFFERKSGHFELANFEGSMEGEAGGISDLSFTFAGTLNGFPALGSLTLDKFTGTARGKLNSHDVDATLEIPHLQVNRDKISGSKLSFSSKLTQPDDNLSAILRAPAFDLADKTLKCPECAVDLDLRQSDRTLQAQLTSPLTLDLNRLQWQLPALAARFTLTHPALSAPLEGKASGQASLDWPEQDFKTALDIGFTGSRSNLALEMKGFAHPAYTFDLGVDQADLDRYLAADWASHGLGDAAPLDLASLKRLNLHGSVRADDVRIARVKLHKLMMDVTAEQASLRLEPITAELYGGTLSASMQLSAQNNSAKFTLKQKLSGIQTDALLQDAYGDSTLKGKGSLNLSLHSEGNSLQALRQSLAGTGSLLVVHGALSGIQLPHALAEGRDWLGLPDGTRSYHAAADDSTEFSELNSELELGQGVANSTEISLRTPLFVAHGAGSLKLDSCDLDYHLDTAVSPTLKRQHAGELAEMKGVSVPAQLSGNCQAPTLQLNFTAASGGNSPRLIKANLAKTSPTAVSPAAPK